MATATAMRKAQHPNISEQLRNIITELRAMFFERGELMEAMMLCVLSKQHGFILGPPGTGKSNLVQELCARFTGANFFDVLLDRQLGKEELFGPIDIPLYEKTGSWERDVLGFLPWAHIFFADEVGKSGPSVLNQLLWAMNERRFRNGKRVDEIPLISTFGASNELLEPELAALWDRFLVRFVVDYIRESSHFAQLLDTAVVKGAPTTRTVVDLADLQHAIEVDVPAIPVPPGVVDNLVKLRENLRSEEIVPSDRRWKALIRLLQAGAYLNGRSIVDDDDLGIGEHVLWDSPDQITKVRQHVTAMQSEMSRQAVRIEQELQEILTNTRAQKGLSTEKRATYGADAKHKLDERDTVLRDLIEKAKRQGRSTAKLETVRDFGKAVKVELYTICMNMTEERARAKIMGTAPDA